jgi:protein AbiQ
MLIFSVENNHVKYLQSFEKHVYSNEDPTYTQTRKYVGYVIEINGWKYYIPLSSPKPGDYNPDRTVKESSLGIMRIKDSSDNTNMTFHGTLRISHMIPVPDFCLIPYDVNGEKNLMYRLLLLSQISFIKLSESDIIRRAKILYGQKTSGKCTSKYISVTLDFRLLEGKAALWIK